MEKLSIVQLRARNLVAIWVAEQKVIGPLAQSFETILNRRYQTIAEDDDVANATEAEMSFQYQLFKELNKGTSVQIAATTVKSFMVWQYKNFQFRNVEADQSEYDEDTEVAERQIERSFTLGAALAAIYAYSIPEQQRDLFLKNVVGMYRGIANFDQVDVEIKSMIDAANDLKEVSEAGTTLMMDYLVNGEQESDKNCLATLMGIDIATGQCL